MILVPQGLDIIDRGLLSMTSAKRLFNTYVDEMVQNFPAVVFPEGYRTEELRRMKPSLFLAVMAASAGKSDPQLSKILNTEVLKAYATRIVINSEKSLELVQSMIVTTVWYDPPDPAGQLKFYEYIHQAATMALDIGLGTKSEISKGQPSSVRRGIEGHMENIPSTENRNVISRSPSKGLDITDVENRRTFLACYVMCSGYVSLLSLRLWKFADRM